MSYNRHASSWNFTFTAIKWKKFDNLMLAAVFPDQIEIYLFDMDNEKENCRNNKYTINTCIRDPYEAMDVLRNKLKSTHIYLGRIKLC